LGCVGGRRVVDCECEDALRCGDLEEDGGIFVLEEVDEGRGGFVDYIGQENKDDEEGEEDEEEHFEDGD